METSGDEVRRLLQSDAAAAASPDPLRQSGFIGDASNWERQRRPMLSGVHRSGTFLDVGCASGYLLECVVAWASADGRVIEPYGVDIGPRLIDLAKRRLPQWSERFFIGDTRRWRPPFRLDFVCTSVYPDQSGDRRPHLTLLMRDYVAPGGRLILRSYFSVTGKEVWNSYFDNAELLRSEGIEPVGASASDPAGAEYVWVDL